MSLTLVGRLLSVRALYCHERFVRPRYRYAHCRCKGDRRMENRSCLAWFGRPHQVDYAIGASPNKRTVGCPCLVILVRACEKTRTFRLAPSTSEVKRLIWRPRFDSVSPGLFGRTSSHRQHCQTVWPPTRRPTGRLCQAGVHCGTHATSRLRCGVARETPRSEWCRDPGRRSIPVQGVGVISTSGWRTSSMLHNASDWSPRSPTGQRVPLLDKRSDPFGCVSL